MHRQGQKSNLKPWTPNTPPSLKPYTRKYECLYSRFEANSDNPAISTGETSGLSRVFKTFLDRALYGPQGYTSIVGNVRLFLMGFVGF